MSRTISRPVPQRLHFRRLVAIGGLLLIGLSLGACSLGDRSDNRRTAAVGGFADALSAASPPGMAEPQAKPGKAARPESRPRPTQPPAVAQPPLQLGSGETDILARLGEPQSRRRNHSAQLWRYGEGACAVDLFFFFDMANDRYRLAMIQQQGQAVVPAAASRCLFQRRTASLLS